MNKAVSVSLKYARIGAQKARLVADLIRGRSVDEALRILSFSDKKAGYLFKKLLESAIASAQEKKIYQMQKLVVDRVFVNQGPSLKRFRPRARGTAYGIRKKTSHLHLELAER
ncbi:MAG: 50S ribosomal protein L22 [Bdellovibrionaceae bacterium]|nr:50S ribosomal protein L22 [Pseudobdellovibrionaceae bacterium]MDW8190069.1 50S ribosomal protein L22 [Pseudobdellovibrionaceae bacterium]